MDDLDLWFAEEILPLEAALTAYLRRAWSDASEIADLRQDVYVRVYDSARRARPASPQAYVFAVARNLLNDRYRERRVVTIDLMEDLSAIAVLSNEVPADRVLSGRQELARLELALGALPPRCRETFVLRKLDGLSQRETAAAMGIAEETVEKQMVKAMRLLTENYWNAGETMSGDTKDDEGRDEKRR